jgi:hypothetical protein
MCILIESWKESKRYKLQYRAKLRDRRSSEDVEEMLGSVCCHYPHGLTSISYSVARLTVSLEE